jgi:hypothetical protein
VNVLGAQPLPAGPGLKIVEPVVVSSASLGSFVSYGFSEELRPTRTPCSTLDRSVHRTELRPIREFPDLRQTSARRRITLGRTLGCANVVFVLTQQVP